MLPIYISAENKNFICKNVKAQFRGEMSAYLDKLLYEYRTRGYTFDKKRLNYEMIDAAKKDMENVLGVKNGR